MTDSLPLPNAMEIFEGETWHYIIQISVFLLSVLFGRALSPQAYRLAIIRRHFKPLEQYAGLYVQVVTSHKIRKDDPTDKPKVVASSDISSHNTHYSILDIHYHHKDDKYVMTGSQYNSDGDRAVVFISNLVGLKKDVLTSIEFIWKTEIILSSLSGQDREETPRVDGYTEMTFVDSDPPETAEGTGFFISFRSHAPKVDFKFFRISDAMIHRFELDKVLRDGKVDRHRPGLVGTRKQGSLVPKTEEGRVEFVRALHKARVQGRHPHLSRHTVVDTPYV